ncbi:MarR family transcriptional regulator [Angustibacter peucedani]
MAPGSEGEPTTTSSSRRGRRPAPAELAAWRSFLRAHAAVTRRLEAELQAEHGVPLAVYDVLVQLVEAPGRRLRMTELAGAVLISRSGLTRLVDRMVRDGHVHREPDPDDARGVWAVLTPAGYDRLRTASTTHLDGVARYVVDRLEPAELQAWGSACAKLAAGDPPPAAEAEVS